MSRSRPLSVYVIGCNDGPQKIGISDNLSSRITNLQTGRAGKLAVAFCEARPLGDARLIERAAHVLLAGKRADGEWFNVSIGEAVEAVRSVHRYLRKAGVEQRRDIGRECFVAEASAIAGVIEWAHMRIT